MSAATVKQAWAAFEKGEHERARSLFLSAKEQEPKSALPCTQEGLYFLKQDEFAAAHASFSQASEREPQNPAPLFFSVVADELGGQTERARTTLDSLTELCPRHQGLASLQLLLDLRHGNPAKALAKLGFGDKPESSGQARQLMAGVGVGDPDWLPPDLSSSDYLLGPILVEVETRLIPLELPRLERGNQQLFEQLEEAESPKRDWREELSGLWRSTKAGAHLNKGKRILERGLNLATLLEQRRQLHKAAAHLRLARKLDPFGFRTSYYLGEAYLFSAKDEPGKPYRRFCLLQAERCFLESVKIDGINPYVLFYLGLCQHLLGRPSEAIIGYQKATEKFEKLPEAHYGAGQCHLLLGDRKKAREMILKAVNSDLVLARERFTLLATLLASQDPKSLERPLPKLPAPGAPQAIKRAAKTDLSVRLGRGSRLSNREHPKRSRLKPVRSRKKDRVNRARRGKLRGRL